MDVDVSLRHTHLLVELDSVCVLKPVTGEECVSRVGSTKLLFLVQLQKCLLKPETQSRAVTMKLFSCSVYAEWRQQTDLEGFEPLRLFGRFSFTWRSRLQNVLRAQNKNGIFILFDLCWVRFSRHVWLTWMTLRECSPRQGSPRSCVRLVTGLGSAFSTAAARRNATPRPSSSSSSAFSARRDKAS